MAPFLKPGELVIVKERVRHRAALRRGDVVVVRPSRLGGKACVKRIVGLPRHTVRAGARTWRLGADEYILLGDNQEDSLDSRAFGPVKTEELVGRVWIRLWPPTRVS